MTKKRRWFWLIGAFLIGSCFGLILRYFFPGGIDASWVPFAYIAVGGVGIIWALAWLAAMASEKWRRP